MKRQRHRLLMILVGLAVAGCGQADNAAQVAAPAPTPTVSTFFREVPAPTSTPRATERPAATSVAVEQTPSPEAAPEQPGANSVEISIFDEQLNPGWSLEQSRGMRYTISKSTTVYSGTVAAMAVPRQAYGTLFFSVEKNATEVYTRDQVLGISFWLSGGPNVIGTEDLVVSVVGSNTRPYWAANDTSVARAPQAPETDPVFSETRLYFLDINQPIPPNTWVQVVVWLDVLLYDPVYKYVTGLYIKNDSEFMTPFFIDDIRIIQEANE